MATKSTVLKPGKKEELKAKDPDLSAEKLAEIQAIKDKIANALKRYKALHKEQMRVQKARDKAEKEQEEAEKELQKKQDKSAEYYKLIMRDCSEFLNATGLKQFLYRGVSSAKFPAFKGMSHKNRAPTDSSRNDQKLFDELLIQNKFKALRRNSIFCTSDFHTASNYGSDLYVIFPVNGFQFTWSPVIGDFFSEIDEAGGVYGAIEEYEYESEQKIILGQYESEQKIILGQLEDLSNDIVAPSKEDLAVIAKLTSAQKVRFNFFVQTIQTLVGNSEDEIWNILTTDKTLRKYLQNFMSKNGDLWPTFTKILWGGVISRLIKIAKTTSVYKPKNILLDLWKYTNRDISAAIKSRNEVLISGTYYAFRQDSSEELLKMLGNRKTNFLK